MPLLTLLARRLSEPPLVWAITAGVSLALQGLPLQPSDLDLQCDADAAYAIEARLAEFVTRPVQWRESERIRSHFGALAIGGIRVEIMGGVEHRLPDGSWHAAPGTAGITRWVEHQGLRLPVTDLAYEAAAYALLGREEKARLIRDFIGGDL